MAADLESIIKLEVPVIVQVAERSLPVEAVVAWNTGAIIELDKTVEDELQLLINNIPIGLGTAVKIGENFGIQISFVGDLKSRIKALGGPLANDQPIQAADEHADVLPETDEALQEQA